MFRLIPQAPVEWRDVFGGALVTALLFTGSKRILAWYLGHVGSYAAYGAVGGSSGSSRGFISRAYSCSTEPSLTRVYADATREPRGLGGWDVASRHG